ncbi:Translocating chain-associated membrane protein 2 [Pteropus alecto]|uniref:Translocating chain-associated membrane protein 2 n=1 Tax=Pteropus alecto TaxID=9402 RepID=L5JLI2_PTEAL|nr:Translocating chain-associated membrane protein 2 [Pteropus alecto]
MAFRRRTKSYPLFSQEFVIHNHADIGFCLVLCVLIGLMFEQAYDAAALPLFSLPSVLREHGLWVLEGLGAVLPLSALRRRKNHEEAAPQAK